jgi:uncharacterized damage-inducible protein DinB
MKTDQEESQMNSTELLADSFDRVRESVHAAVDGLSQDQLGERLEGEANSIAWLVWHLTRVQDDHVAQVAGTEQLYTSAGWVERFNLPLDVTDTGYGHESAEVAVVQSDVATLLGYYDDVHEATLRYVSSLTDADLDRVVDTRFDPPVTLGVRLVSVVSDDLQHAGQAAIFRGILKRR